MRRAARVAEIAKEGYGNRLADGYPYLEAEVIYAVKEEYACSAVDVLARRTRLAFLDVEASLLCVNRVVDLMGATLKWDERRKKEEIEAAKYYLNINAVKNV
jgi:glycerol-3-phosphate dehydrogenase